MRVLTVMGVPAAVGVLTVMGVLAIRAVGEGKGSEWAGLGRDASNSATSGRS
jgi:hypothetical protein